MKNLNQYTTAELAAMTPADVQALIESIWAASGIPMPCPLPTYQGQVFPTDAVAYRVAPSWGLAFSSMEAAQAIVRLAIHTGALVKLDFPELPGTNRRVYALANPSEFDLVIKPEPCYTPDYLAKHMGEIITDETRRADAAMLADVERRNDGKRQAIALEVCQAVNRACAAMNAGSDPTVQRSRAEFQGPTDETAARLMYSAANAYAVRDCGSIPLDAKAVDSVSKRPSCYFRGVPLSLLQPFIDADDYEKNGKDIAITNAFTKYKAATEAAHKPNVPAGNNPDGSDPMGDPNHDGAPGGTLSRGDQHSDRYGNW